MQGDNRRKFEMGERVVRHSDALPDTDPAHTQSVTQVKDVVQRFEVASAAQRAGLIDSRAASKEKMALRREIRIGPLAHLAAVGRRAARENHELGSVFKVTPSGTSFVAFRTAGRSMQAEAEKHKEVLLKYGLSLSVLEHLGQLLDRFDAALTLGSVGRNAHKGATREMTALAAELVAVVRVMDARNRLRFQNDPGQLESWLAASRVVRTNGKRNGAETAEPGPGTTQGTTQGGMPAGTPAGTSDAPGDVRPAA